MSQPLLSMDPLDDVALLQLAVLQQDLLERDVKRPRKEREGEDPENIRPNRGWHRRGGGCIMTLHQTDGVPQSRRPILQLPQDGA